jgi:hypothetical protein
LILALASYKLRFHDRHVRAMPAADLAGRPFDGPGVDLRGAEAQAVLDLAAPLREWLSAREPGVVLRSVSVDRTRPRVLVTLEDEPRPRVIRFDLPHAAELVELAADLERALGRACASKLRAR